MVLTSVAAYAAASSPLASQVMWAAAVGVVVMVSALVAGWRRPVHWAIAIVATAYVTSLYLRGGGLDVWSPLVAAGLVGCAELAHWSIDARLPAVDELAVHIQRGLAVALTVGIGVALAAIVLAASQTIPPAGNVAAAAAIGAVGLALVVAVVGAMRIATPDRGRP